MSTYDLTYRLMWADTVAQFQAQLERRGITRTDREVDHAIQGALEAMRDTLGWYTLPDVAYGDYYWDEIVDGVLERLELSYDEVYEVAL